MKIVLNLFIAFTFFTNLAFAQVSWTIDPAHTNARFEVKHLGIAIIDGAFTKLEGTVETLNETDFDKARVNFTIDVNSINTRIEMRDNHLKSDDFFNAEKYPKMMLTNASLKKTTNNTFTLTGDMTIRDVTKRVVFQVKQNGGIITDPWGKTRAGFTASTEINRFDYNIKYNDKLPTGVDAVAPTVTIIVYVEAVQN